ncbi:Adenine deaminase [Labilithrix luteola]|uniref:Adenine deaminase n=1 Tax=Labilithrix luteola TaxID=1391654 RepID=A0A0K1QG20_9BACT|nr:adenine deaminase [Labilithrix luteola]AKV04617.1 Adenine deaminase [Labilithrix luteola]
MPASSILDRVRRRLRAAQGQEDCDLVLRNVRYLDVFSCTFVRGDVAITDGVIVGLEPGLRAKRELDGKGAHVVPGFIDAHVHLESSLLVPSSFQRAVLPRGTTSAICDPHELANVQGVPGIRYFLDAASRMNADGFSPGLDLRVMLSSCVPATTFETNGAGTLDATALAPLLDAPKALGLAEVMNVPGVLSGDPLVLDKIAAFDGRPLDGHAPLVSGNALSAYACAGITSCHESSELGEAAEKLRKGIAVWIREGSVAKDLDALVPLLTLATSTSIGFCTDDRNPLDIAREGHIDYLVRSAIGKGVAPEVAFRAASWSVARHYGLAGPARNGLRVGAVAPGYRADLLVLDDVATCSIRDVLVAGSLVREIELPREKTEAPPNTIRASIPETKDLEGPSGMVHVIGVREGRILTDRHVLRSDAPGVRRLSVLERHGHGSKPANGYVLGFGELRGAIASSVGHDSHNLCVVGDATSDMRVALAALQKTGGGFCVVRDGNVLAQLALPLGGLMSLEEPETIARTLEELHAASRSIGCALPEPFLQLAFLSLPVIPSLKLTDRGLMDVDAFRLIDVRAA